MGSASNRKSVDWSSTLLSRPSGGLADFMAHGRSPGLRRIADAAFPDFKSSGEKRVGTPFTVAGAATDQRKACRVPFSPSSQSRDRAPVHVPASGGVVKWSSALHRSRARSGSKHRNKSGLHFRGQLLERFGRRASRSKPSSQLPQRGDLGFRNDRANGRDGVFGLG
jgi:hypothetical protein